MGFPIPYSVVGHFTTLRTPSVPYHYNIEDVGPMQQLRLMKTDKIIEFIPPNVNTISLKYHQDHWFCVEINRVPKQQIFHLSHRKGFLSFDIWKETLVSLYV